MSRAMIICSTSNETMAAGSSPSRISDIFITLAGPACKRADTSTGLPCLRRERIRQDGTPKGLSDGETERWHDGQYPSSRRWLKINGSPAARTLAAAAATS